MKRTLFYVVALLCLCSCGNTLQEVTYFQDLPFNSSQDIDSVGVIKMEPDDQISIMVSCKDPELSMLFNLVTVQNRVGSNNAYSGNNYLSYYLLSKVYDFHSC